jgi:CBS domain containing-hemolysin-like protein
MIFALPVDRIVLIKTFLYLIFVFISAYFASIETALLRFSAKKFVVDEKLKFYITFWENNPALILSCILIGTNLSCEGIGVLSNSLGINIIFSTFLLLIFGEILPKIYALTHSEKILKFGLKILLYFSKIIQPVANFFVGFSSYILSFFIGEKANEQPFLSSEELKEVISYDENVSKEEQTMYANVIELADKRIYEIMVPKEDIVAINQDSSIEEIIESLSKTKFSRVPVYKGNIDNIVGIVYTKDVTVAIQNKNLLLLNDIIREPYFVINTAKVVDILKQFRQGRHHLAIVVDEYGATVGLVTIEDIIEEIFGEIYDEYDVKEEKIFKLAQDTYIISGDETLKNVNEILNTNFVDEEVVTFSGYIITRLGYVPQKGFKINLENLEVEIIDSTNKVINKIKVRVLNK